MLSIYQEVLALQYLPFLQIVPGGLAVLELHFYRANLAVLFLLDNHLHRGVREVLLLEYPTLPFHLKYDYRYDIVDLNMTVH
jgi:hypothetical protein